MYSPFIFEPVHFDCGILFNVDMIRVGVTSYFVTKLCNILLLK